MCVCVWRLQMAPDTWSSRQRGRLCQSQDQGQDPGAASMLSSPELPLRFPPACEEPPPLQGRARRTPLFLQCSQSCSQAGPCGLLCVWAFSGSWAARWDAQGSVTYTASCVLSPWQAGNTPHMQSTRTPQGLRCQNITKIH